MARRKVRPAAMAVTSAAMARKTGVLVCGEVTRRETAAKGPGVEDTPPLTSFTIDGASEDAGRAVPFRADVPVADHALRRAAGNRPVVIVELMGPRTKDPFAEPVIPFSSLRLFGRSPESES